MPLLTLLGLIAASAAPDMPATLQVVAVAPDHPGRLRGDERWLIYLDGPVDPLGWFLQPASYLPDEVNPHLTLEGQLQYKNFITWEVSYWSFAAGCAS